MARKGLNDALSNNRDVARAAHGRSSTHIIRGDDLADLTGHNGGWVKTVATGACADTHPPLPIVVGDKTYHVNGGSAAHPKAGSNVLIDVHGYHNTAGFYPWNSKMMIEFPIMDMSVPKDAEEFKKLIEFAAGLIVKGYNVAVGCIGGHGRTGMVLSALVKHMTGNEDAIQYVRDNYCKKAVESTQQVQWLGKHFGIKPVAGSKQGGVKTSKSYGGGLDFAGSTRDNDRILPLGPKTSIW